MDEKENKAIHKTIFMLLLILGGGILFSAVAFVLGILFLPSHSSFFGLMGFIMGAIFLPLGFLAIRNAI